MISYNMNKIHWFMDIIGQFVALNRRAIEEPTEALTFYLRVNYLFISIECTKDDVIVLSVARNQSWTKSRPT